MKRDRFSSEGNYPKMVDGIIVGMPLEVKWLTVLFILCAAISVAFVPKRNAPPGSQLLLVLAGFFVVLAVSFRKRVSIDCSAGVLTEEKLFWSRVQRSEHFPLSEFKGISHKEALNKKEALIGLRHRSGRMFWLWRFPPASQRLGFEVEDSAYQLSSDTGLRIDDRLRTKP